MDHLGILNTVDSTGAFRVAGVANRDVLSFSGFWVWQVKGTLKKIGCKNFRRCCTILSLCL